MGCPESEGRMEGWLSLIRFNRFGLQYSRKRFFILENNCLNSFKSVPTSEEEEPLRSAIIDSCIRVTDNGRESHHRRVFFIFTLYNTSDHNDQLKLGASSSEGAAKWIRSLQEVALSPVKDLVAFSERKWQPFRLSISKRTAHKSFVERVSVTSMHVDAMTSDVVAPSPWKIFGCQNGLRLFMEANQGDAWGRVWNNPPAIMAVGVVEGSSEVIFRTIMSLGPSRSEWDFSFYRGSVVEHLDGHTDIIHIKLCSNWLPWGMQRRDLLLRRYWRREDDGTYVILYHSVVHRKCPPEPGYVRASLKSGGFVISPSNQGKEAVVKNMLAIDWKFWKSYLQNTSDKFITIQALGRVAALRELFRAKAGQFPFNFSSEELTRDTSLPLSEKEEIKKEVLLKVIEEDTMETEPRHSLSGPSSLMGLNDAADEFFDVPEPSDDDAEHYWRSSPSPETDSEVLSYKTTAVLLKQKLTASYHLVVGKRIQSAYTEDYQPKLSSAANFVKILHDLAVQKKGYVDLQELAWEDNVSCHYGATLAKDSSCSMPCSWAAGDPSSFLIRGSTYLEDHQKIKAKGTLMEMVAADWIRSEKREDDLGGRPGGIVHKHAVRGGSEFFFIINIQVPGATQYSLALYYMMKSPLEEIPLLESFVNGDDTYRNSRFKLIPYISKGSWIVKQSVGKKACLVGQALEVHYFRGKNYLELDVDVGSSTVARGVVNLVLGYLNNLVIEMAFLIQANTQEELPELLLGTCRLNHLDAGKSVAADSINSS